MLLSLLKLAPSPLFNARFRIVGVRCVLTTASYTIFSGICWPGELTRVASLIRVAPDSMAQCRRRIAVSRFALERFPSISQRIVTGHPRTLTLPFSRGAGITRLLSLLGSLAASFCFRSRNERFFGKAQRDTATLPRTMAEFSYRSRAIVARDPEKTQAISTWELQKRSDNRACMQESAHETSRSSGELERQKQRDL